MTAQTAKAPKPPCSVGNCGQESFAKNLCYAHYRRQQRGGDITTPVARRQGLVEVPNTGVRMPKEFNPTFQAVAKAQNLSDYEMLRSILAAWYERTTGRKLDMPPPTAR